MISGCRKFLGVLILFVPLSSLAVLPVFDLYVSVPGEAASNEVMLQHLGHVSVIRSDQYQGSAGAGQELGGLARRYVPVSGDAEKKTLSETDVRKQYTKSKVLKRRKNTSQQNKSGEGASDAGKGKNRYGLKFSKKKKKNKTKEQPQPQEQFCIIPQSMVLWRAPHTWALQEGEMLKEDVIVSLVSSDSSGYMYLQPSTTSAETQIAINNIPVIGQVSNTLSYQLENLLTILSLHGQGGRRTTSQSLSSDEGGTYSRQRSGDGNMHSSSQPRSEDSKRSGSFEGSGPGILNGKQDSGLGFSSYSPGNLDTIERTSLSARVNRFSVSLGIDAILDSVSFALDAPGFVDPLFGITCTSTIELLFNEGSSEFALVLTIPDPVTGVTNTVILVSSDPVTITPQLAQLLGVEVTDPEVFGEMEMDDPAGATNLPGTPASEDEGHMQGFQDILEAGGQSLEITEPTEEPPDSPSHDYEEIPPLPGQSEQQLSDHSHPSGTPSGAQSTQTQAQSDGSDLGSDPSDDGYGFFDPGAGVQFSEKGDGDGNNQYRAIPHPTSPNQPALAKSGYELMWPADSKTQSGDLQESDNPPAVQTQPQQAQEQEDYYNVWFDEARKPVLNSPPPGQHVPGNFQTDYENVEVQDGIAQLQVTGQGQQGAAVTQGQNSLGSQEQADIGAAAAPLNPNENNNAPPGSVGSGGGGSKTQGTSPDGNCQGSSGGKRNNKKRHVVHEYDEVELPGDDPDQTADKQQKEGSEANGAAAASELSLNLQEETDLCQELDYMCVEFWGNQAAQGLTEPKKQHHRNNNYDYVPAPGQRLSEEEEQRYRDNNYDFVPAPGPRLSEEEERRYRGNNYDFVVPSSGSQQAKSGKQKDKGKRFYIPPMTCSEEAGKKEQTGPRDDDEQGGGGGGTYSRRPQTRNRIVYQKVVPTSSSSSSGDNNQGGSTRKVQQGDIADLAVNTTGSERLPLYFIQFLGVSR
ncbi:MAG: hypothetical protein ACR2PT_22175 [Endozoicomonas sp.]